MFHLYTGQQLDDMIETELSDPKYNTKLTVQVEDKDLENMKKKATDDKRKDMKARQVEPKSGKSKPAKKISMVSRIQGKGRGKGLFGKIEEMF